MYKVMIVDDEDIIVSGLVKVMPWAKYGCEVAATASDGLAAQAVLREKRPDILFTDICMPGADGLALLAAVRSEFPDMQVTILSGFPDFEYAQRAIGLGVVRYVLKPSKMHELEEALAVMVENLGGAPASGAVQSAENAQNFIIKKAVQYIEQHYAEKLTLPDVADKVYVSQWHLSKLIAKNTGQSFSDLLNGVRIAKAKELLAYLIDHRGAAVTTGEAYAALFEDMENSVAGKSYFRTIVHSMKTALKKAGAEEILVKGFNSMAVVPENMDCDYYRFLKGDPIAVNQYRNDYLPSYSWAEARNGSFEFERGLNGGK